MRIVSQDGKIDMPYEMVGIFRFKTWIYYLNENLTGVGSLDEDVRMAEYSTEAKAVKAMEMLREVYAGMPVVMQNVAISEDFEKGFEKLKKCGVMVRSENQPSKVECISNVVFQFPQDNEIEV